MKPYKEFQFAWWLLFVLIPIMVGMNLGVFNDSLKSVSNIPYLVFNITCGVIFILFFGMTTRVDGSKIKVSFGIGLIRKTIDVSNVKDIDLVQNPFIYGWGIRMIPSGWLYNISGSHGIELQFTDRESIVRIGSKDSALLRKVILTQTGKQAS